MTDSWSAPRHWRCKFYSGSSLTNFSIIGICYHPNRCFKNSAVSATTMKKSIPIKSLRFPSEIYAPRNRVNEILDLWGFVQPEFVVYFTIMNLCSFLIQWGFLWHLWRQLSNWLLLLGRLLFDWGLWFLVTATTHFYRRLDFIILKNVMVASNHQF